MNHLAPFSPVFLYTNDKDRFLALICLMRKESIERQGLVDYNVQIFQQALQRVFEIGSGGAGLR
jgi:Ras-related GTP-binding protein C/D